MSKLVLWSLAIYYLWRVFSVALLFLKASWKLKYMNQISLDIMIICKGWPYLNLEPQQFDGGLFFVGLLVITIHYWMIVQLLNLWYFQTIIMSPVNTSLFHLSPFKSIIIIYIVALGCFKFTTVALPIGF